MSQPGSRPSSTYRMKWRSSRPSRAGSIPTSAGSTSAFSTVIRCRPFTAAASAVRARPWLAAGRRGPARPHGPPGSRTAFGTKSDSATQGGPRLSRGPVHPEIPSRPGLSPAGAGSQLLVEHRPSGRRNVLSGVYGAGMASTDYPWEPPMAGTEAEQLTGALDRLRTTFRWKADDLDAP